MKAIQVVGLFFGLLSIIASLLASQQLSSVNTEVIGSGILGLAYSLGIVFCIIVYALTGATSTVLIFKEKNKHTSFRSSKLWKSIYYLNILISLLFIVLFLIIPIIFLLITAVNN